MRVLQLNVNGSKLVSSELGKLVEELNADVVCLQEPYTIGGKIQGFLHRDKIITGAQHAKAAIIVRNQNLIVTQLTHLCTEHLVTAEIIENETKWVISSMYAQFSHDIEPYANHIGNIADNTGNRKMIITADINAKSSLWHSNTTDARGQIIVNVLNDHQLYIANRAGQPATFYGHTGAKSNIDITIANDKALPLVTRWEVIECATHSDHNAIIIHLTSQNTVTDTQTQHQRLLRHKTNWTKLTDTISDFPIDMVDGSVDYRAHYLTEILQRAQQVAIPTASDEPRRKIPWTAELTRLRQDSRKKRKVYQRAANNTDKQQKLEEYLVAKRKYDDRLTQIKKDKFDKQAQNQLQVDIWGEPYKVQAEKIKKPMTLSTLKRDDGTTTKGWRTSAEFLLNKLLPDDTDVTDEPHHKLQREYIHTDYTAGGETIPFTQHEVSLAIARLKKQQSSRT